MWIVLELELSAGQPPPPEKKEKKEEKSWKRNETVKLF